MNGRVLVVPSHKTMDHVWPAVREQKPALVILVPLHEAIEKNLQKFADDLLIHNITENDADADDDDVIGSVVKVDSVPKDGGKETWQAIWLTWLISAHRKMGMPRHPELRILLNPELPLGIILGTATAALALPRLRIFEVPSGYNLRRYLDDYNPGAPMSEQIIEFETWSHEGVNDALIHVTRSPKLTRLLLVMRDLAQQLTTPEFSPLENLEVKRKAIWMKLDGVVEQELTPKRKGRTSSQSLSNYLKRAQGFELGSDGRYSWTKVCKPLIESTTGRRYRLTRIGVLVTGLLSARSHQELEHSQD